MAQDRSGSNFRIEDAFVVGPRFSGTQHLWGIARLSSTLSSPIFLARSRHRGWSARCRLGSRQFHRNLLGRGPRGTASFSRRKGLVVDDAVSARDSRSVKREAAVRARLVAELVDDARIREDSSGGDHPGRGGRRRPPSTEMSPLPHRASGASVRTESAAVTQYEHRRRHGASGSRRSLGVAPQSPRLGPGGTGGPDLPPQLGRRIWGVEEPRVQLAQRNHDALNIEWGATTTPRVCLAGCSAATACGRSKQAESPPAGRGGCSKTFPDSTPLPRPSAFGMRRSSASESRWRRTNASPGAVRVSSSRSPRPRGRFSAHSPSGFGSRRQTGRWRQLPSQCSAWSNGRGSRLPKNQRAIRRCRHSRRRQSSFEAREVVQNRAASSPAYGRLRAHRARAPPRRSHRTHMRSRRPAWRRAAPSCWLAASANTRSRGIRTPLLVREISGVSFVGEPACPSRLCLTAAPTMPIEPGGGSVRGVATSIPSPAEYTESPRGSR